MVRGMGLIGFLLGAFAIPAAADQGRGGHDTPAIERQWGFISPDQYKARACRTDVRGWVSCERSGQWWQQENQRRHRGYPDSGDDWIGRQLRL
jgi:hypothetical protein